MNGLEVAQRAVDLWGRYSTRTKASAYLWCQSFSGFYIPWAVTGREPSITYGSARLAALASSIFTKDVNARDVQPGDNIFFEWGSDWHVVVVAGRDASGRTLVIDTSSSGDTVRSLGRHVYIRRADTISLRVYGVARANGRAPRVTFDAWGGDAPAGGGGQPAASTGVRIDLRDGWAWYTSAADAVAERNPHGPRWTGELLARGVYAVLQAPNAIQVRANDGSAIWVSPKARDRIQGTVAASPAPVPAKRRYVRLGEPWYFYRQLDNALRGNYAAGQMLPAGDYALIRIHGTNGPRLVESPHGQVWVGSKTVPPVIEK